MRQLKGKVKKETSKDKKERRKEFSEAKQMLMTVVLPVCGVFIALLVGLVLYRTNFTL